MAKKKNQSWKISKKDRKKSRTAESGNGNGDAMTLRASEPGSLEYEYMHRYDSPDNQRDSMG